MTTGIKKDGSLESKFLAYFLRKQGYRVIQIAEGMKKDRGTIYYRIDLMDGWLRSYPEIREKYLLYVSNWLIGVAA